MTQDDKLITVLEKISEVSERTARIEVQLTTVKQHVDAIQEQDIKQNELLAEHIQGTVANTERLNLEIEARKSFESRVEKLEKIPQYVKTSYQILMYLGVVVGIVYESGRILRKW
jgi:hypothetical protein